MYYIFVWNDSKDVEGWSLADPVDSTNYFDDHRTAFQALKRYRDTYRGLFAILTWKPAEYVVKVHCNEIENKNLKEKHIYFTTEYATYSVPLSMIAHDRAKYYADVDTTQLADNPEKRATWDSIYDEEFWYTWDNPEEAIDWLRSNYNWDDIKLYARVVKYTIDPKNDQEYWLDARYFEVS